MSFRDELRQATLEALLNMAELQHQEGYVLKVMACDGWWKLKGINEADVYVTGFKISDADTRKGMVTAVEVAVVNKEHYSVNMGNVSGFNLEEMGKMTEAYNKYGLTRNGPNKNPYFGKVLRVIYQEIAGQGKMKHGFFDCWRDDKNQTSCWTTQFKGE